METIKVEEQLFCLNSEFWNINMNKGMGCHPDSIMRNPYIQSTSEFSLKVFIFIQSTCRISGFKTSKVNFEEFLSALQPTRVIPSIAWRLIFHDATQAATCTRVLTLDVAVTLNSKAGSSTDSRAVVNRPHRGILGNLYRLCCSGIMVEIILWVLFFFFFLKRSYFRVQISLLQSVGQHSRSSLSWKPCTNPLNSKCFQDRITNRP